jgi:hypothetical protein
MTASQANPWKLNPSNRRLDRTFKRIVVRRALMTDALSVDALLSEWFDWKPKSGRLESVRRSVRKRELLVAEVGSRIIGFIHFVTHEDIIDGAPNSFIWNTGKGSGPKDGIVSVARYVPVRIF